MNPRSVVRQALERVESGFDAAFGARLNPLYQLGALGWFFYWIVAVSGLYLYVFFDTGIERAYASVEYMTHEQWYAAGVMRSLHRYASDALVVVVLLHLAREFVLDRYRGARWFPWFVGTPILWLIYASGISGYWVVWDKLAQYVAVATAEWLDALPIFGEPIARNFLHESVLSGRFFTLMVFIHIAVPLILLLVMWIHISRHTHARSNPPKALAIGSLAALVVLALAYPAVSQGPANLNEVPAVVSLDWFYLPLYPLFDRYSGLALWGLVGGVTLLLALLPWLPPKRVSAAATVHLDNCNGCGRCEADCPYSAITMVLRTDGAPFSQQAQVDDGRCVRCGICTGACPTATPYRRRSELVAGIELPQLSMQSLRDGTVAAVEKLRGDTKVIVYACDSAAARGLENDHTAVVNVPCVGHLPPALLDFTLTRRHADGVLLAGCRRGDCAFRLGIDWTEQRLAGLRDPYLRKRVPRERIHCVWAGFDGRAVLLREAAAFTERLRSLGSFKPGERGPAGAPAGTMVEN